MEKNIQTGKRIQIRREELRMNLGDVAKEVGVAVSTIQRYEKGKIEKIKLPVIEAIAKALRVNPAWLLGETDQMQLPDPATIDNLIPLPKTIRFPCWATSPAAALFWRKRMWKPSWRCRSTSRRILPCAATATA